MKKLALMISIAAVFSSISTPAQDKTPWSLYGKIDFNYNSYSADNLNYGVICPECFQLQKGSGSGLGLGLGALYNPDDLLYGMKYTLGALLNYNVYSGAIDNDKALANIISGNTVTKAILNVKSDHSIQMLELEPFVYIYPFKSIKTAFKFGLSLSLPIVKDYELTEQVKSANMSFPDGSITHKYKKTEIPDVTSFVLGIPIGLKYDALQIGNFAVSPEFNYTIPLTTMHDASKLYISQASFGAAFEYRIAKPMPDEPVAPPMPAPPSPIQESKVDAVAKFIIDGKYAANSENVEYLYSTKTSYIDLPLVPIIYFDKNSDKIKNSENASQKREFNKREKNANDLGEIVEFAKSAPKIKITVSATDDENEDIIEKRLNTVENLLAESGIDKKNIQSEVKIVPVKKLRYPEIAEESRNATLSSVNEENNAYSIKVELNKEIILKDLKANLEIDATSNAGIKKIQGKYTLANREIAQFAQNKNELTIEKSQFIDLINAEKIPFSAAYNVVDSAGADYNGKSVINIIPKLDKDEAIVNAGIDERGAYREYVLALNAFDKYNPYYFDKKASEALKNAIKSGIVPEVFGLSDDLGKEEYNAKLSQRRAKYALKAIGVDIDSVKLGDGLTMKANSFIRSESRSTPIGRVLRRAVIIKIYDK
jgi:outer membrane protein OmpA-like peptidoglycan-associated protein